MGILLGSNMYPDQLRWEEERRLCNTKPKKIVPEIRVAEGELKAHRSLFTPSLGFSL